MKTVLSIMFIFLALPLYATWSDYDLELISTGVSSQEGAVKFELKDAAGHLFYLNSPKEPDASVIKKIVKYKDDFFTWELIRIRELSFYMYENGIQAAVVPSGVTYSGSDLKPYLPSDFTFIEGANGLDYRYRIIVEGTSLKLNGSYNGEEPMLKEMLAYITGIREKKIIVEDEKIVSGSVVSISSEKELGEKQIYPVDELPDFNRREVRKTEDRNIRLYFSAHGSYLVPSGFFGDLYVGGYGFTASIGLRDLGLTLIDKPFLNFDIEINGGFWYLSKEKQDAGQICTIKNAYIIPLGLIARSHLGITSNLFVSPSFGFGYYFNKLEYVQIDLGAEKYISTREWNPSLLLGLRLDYQFTKIFIFAGAEYLMMFERQLNLSALLFNAGSGYYF